jgi:hypothetical protein
VIIGAYFSGIRDLTTSICSIPIPIAEANAANPD